MPAKRKRKAGPVKSVGRKVAKAAKKTGAAMKRVVTRKGKPGPKKGSRKSK